MSVVTCYLCCPSVFSNETTPDGFVWTLSITGITGFNLREESCVGVPHSELPASQWKWPGSNICLSIILLIPICDGIVNFFIQILIRWLFGLTHQMFNILTHACFIKLVFQILNFIKTIPWRTNPLRSPCWIRSLI